MLVESLLLFSFLLAWWVYLTRLPSTYPPTPYFRLPFYGHIPYLLAADDKGSEGKNILATMYKKYSKNGVLALHVGNIKTVLLGDFELIKEAFKNEELNSRFPSTGNYEKMKRLRLMSEGSTGKEGIIHNTGKKWQEQRRFMMTTLRDFGFGKASMDGLINDEVGHFIKYLKEESTKGYMEVQNFYNIAILNVIWRVINGDRFDYYDPRLRTLLKHVYKIIAVPPKKFNISRLFPFMEPILAYLGIRHSKELEMFEARREIRDFLEETISAHQTTYDPSYSRDFVDSYIQMMRKNEGTHSSFASPGGNEELSNVLHDLFFAGSETTSSTLSWATLFMIRHPDVQERVRREILNVIGRDTVPSYDDLRRMPYTEATLMEIQRLGDIAPNALPHSTMLGPVQIGPYIIPQGHLVQGLLTIVHKSPDNWSNPMEFDPSRHLSPGGNKVISEGEKVIHSKGDKVIRSEGDKVIRSKGDKVVRSEGDKVICSEGDRVIRSEKLIPFAIGKRQCPGESLARAELFLFFTGLLQKFRFSAKDPDSPPPIEFTSSVTSVPLPYKVKIEAV